MKIHSPFKDYYDTFMYQYGYDDPSIRWIRKEKTIENVSVNHYIPSKVIRTCSIILNGTRKDWHDKRRVKGIKIVVICGEAKLFFMVGDEYEYSYNYTTICDFEELSTKYFDLYDFKWYEKSNIDRFSIEDTRWPIRKELVESPVGLIEFRSNYDVIANGKCNVVWNARLNKISNIGKFYPPYDMYQQVEKYLANQAVPIMEAPKLDDITMRDIKGFDKFSFKKEKGKK